MNRLNLAITFAMFGLLSILLAAAVDFPLTTNEETEVGQKLEAYESGKLTLDELTLNGGEESRRELIGYYQLHSNHVTLKMKLPVSRCFAAFNRYEEAAKLSAEYVRVYSKDWRGWKILGGANFLMGDVNAAIGALTNSARLGDDGSYAALGLAALNAERLDVFRDIISHLLILKRSKSTSEVNPLDIVMLLVGYSLRVNQQDLFIKALDGVDAKQILSRDDLKQLVTTGCERFKGKDVDRIRQEIEPLQKP
jgi:hypothetical protein